MIDQDKYASATVVARRDPAPDLWIIRIRTESELPYRPGQYVTVGLQSNGRIIERPYSICSSPVEDEIELFIERVPEGELSDPLFALGVGGELIVRRRTKGLFLREAPLLEQPHLFVATVTGIAPFVSLLRTLAGRARSGDWTPVPIVTIQGAARSAEASALTVFSGYRFMRRPHDSTPRRLSSRYRCWPTASFRQVFRERRTDLDGGTARGRREPF